ncbi:hypothetical protein CAEBREN_01234 [Caenorhabditis brenneri]|uniref:Uncharacterized protein n=1 Tax=Caenorhabditis brenneri TaxID=135651 RepID=G0NV69_CAEBE|nr:hypothetical protein CAEBREN_01234 [Caenorhabditis brenneri]
MAKPLLTYFVFQFLMNNLEGCLPSGSKCQTNTCVMIPPSPPSYAMAPMLSMHPSLMSAPPAPPPPPPMSSYQMAPPPPPQYPMPHSPHGPSSMMMMGSQIPFLSALDPPIPPISPVSSSAYSTPPEKNQYELSPEVQRWDRQEPEYKHIDEAEAVVAPDVVVAEDTVDEKSTNSEKVEKLHENERLARMDLKYEEPEPTPFDNGTVTFHAWFVRKL